MASVTVWNEFVHERELEEAAEIYPDGMHAVLAEALEDRGHDVDTATLDDPEHGLSEAALEGTDVLVWWGHAAHDEVTDAEAERVVERVRSGMGFVPLHSACHSKPFLSLMGTTGSLKWREAAETERLWVIEPGHRIADGVDGFVEIPAAEMYGERFDIPAPDELVLVSWFEGGNVFRSGCCYRRGKGKVFYFRPGHETYPVFYQDEVQHVIGNAVEWATADADSPVAFGNEPEPHSPIRDEEDDLEGEID